MKILYVLDSLAVGGSERSLLAIGRRLRETEPIMCHLHPADALRAQYEAAGIPVTCLELEGDKAFFEGARRLLPVIRRIQPDLIHSTLFGAGIVTRLASLRPSFPPLVHTWVNEPPAHSHPDNRNWIWRKRAAQLLDTVTSRRVRHFVANSRAIAESHHRAYRIASQRITVIPRGRDPDCYGHVEPSVVIAARRDLGLTAEDRVILNVARLWHWKGQQDLIEAWPAVLHKEPRACLVIVGEGPERPLLEARIRELGLNDRVRLAGYRHDVPTLLHMAEIFAFPSRYEGMPGAVLEALFAGLPVVLSDIPVHRETLGEDAQECFAPTGDPAAWAATLTSFLARPEDARRRGEEGRQRAQRHFDVDDVARRHEELYRRVLDR